MIKKFRLLRTLSNLFQTKTTELAENLHKEFDFDLVTTGSKIRRGIDTALQKDWVDHSKKKSILFIPTNKETIGKWLAKAVYEHRKGATVIGIIPVEMNKRWFHQYVQNVAAEVRYLKMPRFSFMGLSLLPENIAVVIYRLFKGFTSFTNADEQGKVTQHLN